MVNSEGGVEEAAKSLKEMVNAKTGERLKGELQGREEPVVSVRRRFLCCRLIDAVTSKPLQGATASIHLRLDRPPPSIRRGERVMGFEPTTTTLATWCSTN
jgi:hypothetical protein